MCFLFLELFTFAELAWFIVIEGYQQGNQIISNQRHMCDMNKPDGLFTLVKIVRTQYNRVCSFFLSSTIYIKLNGN